MNSRVLLQFFCALALLLPFQATAQTAKERQACLQSQEAARAMRDAASKVTEQFRIKKDGKRGRESDLAECEHQTAWAAESQIYVDTILEVEKTCGPKLAKDFNPRCNSDCWKKMLVEAENIKKIACKRAQ